MGHGICDNLSRSTTFARYPDTAAVLQRAARSLLSALRCPPQDIRGLGLVVRPGVLGLQDWVAVGYS
jgi:DNA repair protein REV1